MIVAIDAGNTRIKWGVHDGGDWRAAGVVATVDADRLAEAIEDWPAGARVSVCNVAGPDVAATLDTQLAGRGLAPRWLRASAHACGVTNGYEHPEQLGADRWAALIGAWNLFQRGCLVVCAGTATTLDVLDERGHHQGGLILPGYDLMRRSLSAHTAQLPLVDGDYAGIAHNTRDAIVSGCLNAQAGAIERVHRTLPAGTLLVLSGGAATRLAACLAAGPRIVDNLVLEGLLRHARHEAPPT